MSIRPIISEIEILDVKTEMDFYKLTLIFANKLLRGRLLTIPSIRYLPLQSVNMAPGFRQWRD